MKLHQGEINYFALKIYLMNNNSISLNTYYGMEEYGFNSFYSNRIYFTYFRPYITKIVKRVALFAYNSVLGYYRIALYSCSSNNRPYQLLWHNSNNIDVSGNANNFANANFILWKNLPVFIAIKTANNTTMIHYNNNYGKMYYMDAPFTNAFPNEINPNNLVEAEYSLGVFFGVL